MTDYRVYCFDAKGHVAKGDWIDAKSDDEAIILVRRMAGKTPFEIWKSDRLVAQNRRNEFDEELGKTHP